MKKIFIIILMCVASLMSFAQQQIPADWDAIKTQHPYPQWFSDAKLGIFIHWGLYSVPAYSHIDGYAEWFYRGLMLDDSVRVNFMKKNFGEDFQYRDFAPLFTAELFDANEWADLFQHAGARYIILVTKHHDGYCLWNSQYAPEWNSVVSGPHRDIVAEVSEAVKAKGIRLGFYYSLPEWTNPLHIWTVDPNDSIAAYVDKHMIPQFKELLTKYRPTLLFTDGEWDNTAEQWHAKELISWYYNLMGPEAIVNDRWGHGADYGFKTPEYKGAIMDTVRPWAECRGIGRSFGLNRNEPLENYLTSDELIRHFVVLVAAGGGMTLNVGPAADGQIPLLQQERLIDLGNWLKINGEAIYGSRPYNRMFEYESVQVTENDSTYTKKEPSICYTQNNGNVYAITMHFPDDQLVLNIPDPGKNTVVTLLGCDKMLPWMYKKGQLIIDTRSLKVSDLHSSAAFTFRIGQ